MPGPATPPTIENVSQLVEQLPFAVRAMSLTVADAFTTNGVYILTALTVIVVVLGTLKTMLAQGGFVDTLSDLIRAVLIWGLAAWFLRDYPVIMTPLWDTFDAISNRIAEAGAAGGTGGLPTGVAGAAGLYQAVNRILSVLGTAWTGGYSSGWDRAVYILSGLPQILETTLLAMVAAGLLVMATAVYMLVFATGKCLLAVGLALGPLLIPWIAFESTRGFFESWIRFCVSAGLYQVVATVLMKIVAPMIRYVDDWSKAMVASGTDFNADILVAGMAITALMSILITVLLLQAPYIAAALAGGGVRVVSGMSLPKGPDAAQVRSGIAWLRCGGSSRAGAGRAPISGRGG